MPAFPYHPALKGPGPLDRVDLSNPALTPLVRMTAANLQKEARAFLGAPPAGVRAALREVTAPNAPALPCYVLEPAATPVQAEILYCHGGAFFFPVQVSSLRLAAQLAAGLCARVFLPEYRLLPEHPAPAAFFDCLAAWGALDTERPALLYGESAGGALAAGTALYARAHGLAQPRGLALIYPVLDDLRGDYPSRTACDGAAWTLRSERTMWQRYLPDPAALAALEPYLVPMRADPAALRGLPPVYIEPQEFDILRDEAAAFARRLAAAGVPVTQNLVRGSYHGFDADTENPFVRAVTAQRLAALRAMLSEKGVEPTP